ncbi:MAG: PrsW family glutamic-type intramembrane protease, partial [Patescibacteria group bacterium]
NEHRRARPCLLPRRGSRRQFEERPRERVVAVLGHQRRFLVQQIVEDALGFATLENLGALQGNNLPETALISGAALNIAFQTVSLRFIGATLLHTLTSAVVGYYWAMDIREFFERRLLLVGLTFATVLHAVFNYLIINHRDLSYALIFVVTIGFFVLSDFEKFRKKPV